MTSKVIEGHKSASNFSVNPTLPVLDDPLMLPSPNCVDYYHFPFRFLLLSLSIPFYLPLLLHAKFNLHSKRSHEATLMWRDYLIIFRSFDQITTLTYVLMDNFCPCFSHN